MLRDPANGGARALRAGLVELAAELYPKQLVGPAGFVECAAALSPDVQTVPTAVGDVVGWEA